MELQWIVDRSGLILSRGGRVDVDAESEAA
jgi:hypothetical protein